MIPIRLPCLTVALQQSTSLPYSHHMFHYCYRYRLGIQSPCIAYRALSAIDFREYGNNKNLSFSRAALQQPAAQEPIIIHVIIVTPICYNVLFMLLKGSIYPTHTFPSTRVPCLWWDQPSSSLSEVVHTCASIFHMSMPSKVDHTLAPEVRCANAIQLEAEMPPTNATCGSLSKRSTSSRLDWLRRDEWDLWGWAWEQIFIANHDLGVGVFGFCGFLLPPASTTWRQLSMSWASIVTLGEG